MATIVDFAREFSRNIDEVLRRSNPDQRLSIAGGAVSFLTDFKKFLDMAGLRLDAEMLTDSISHVELLHIAEKIAADRRLSEREMQNAEASAITLVERIVASRHEIRQRAVVDEESARKVFNKARHVARQWQTILRGVETVVVRTQATSHQFSRQKLGVVASIPVIPFRCKLYSADLSVVYQKHYPRTSRNHHLIDNNNSGNNNNAVLAEIKVVANKDFIGIDVQVASAIVNEDIISETIELPFVTELDEDFVYTKSIFNKNFPAAGDIDLTEAVDALATQIAKIADNNPDPNDIPSLNVEDARLIDL